MRDSANRQPLALPFALPFALGALAAVAAIIATPAAAAEPAGPRYYRAAGSNLPFSEAVRAGDLVFASGQIGRLPDGSVPADFAQQSRIALDHIAASLAQAGSSMDAVVKCTVMLTDMARWAEFNRIYVGYFKPERMPARSALGATALAFGASVEVECIAAATPAVVPAASTTPPPILPAAARRSIRAGGSTLRYEVSWAEHRLDDATGVPQATISATSYVLEGVKEPRRRPVLFAFNGGPGASSSPLHFGLLGPRRLSEPDGQGVRAFSDNAETLLDVADLVMIDPVGTGFSRELRSGGGSAYWDPDGDARAVEALIRAWLRDHGRGDSPVYIVGESYGGFRLAMLAPRLGDLDVAGLVLVSPATDLAILPGSDQVYIADLPAMAVTALAQGRIDAAGRDADQVYEEARAFAQGEYAAALQLGTALAPAERDRLAARMSRLIGLPAATIATVNLRVASQDFLEQLVPGRIVGRIDTRVSAPRPAAAQVPGRAKEADDPALAMGASNVKKSKWVRDYLRNEVGVRTERDYVSLTLDVNFGWNWNPGTPKFEDNLGRNATPGIARLMGERPATRLLLLSGYYDLATPVLAQRYALTHAGIPMERTRLRAFASGHAPYGEDASRAAVSAELHAFISGGAATASSPARSPGASQP